MTLDYATKQYYYWSNRTIRAYRDSGHVIPMTPKTLTYWHRAEFYRALCDNWYITS